MALLKNLSNFKNVGDYLPIVVAALIVDMVVLSRVVSGGIKIKSLDAWYNKFGLLAVIADVLSIVIGIVISRFLYTLLFKNYYLILFLLLTVLVQVTHDLSFAWLFNTIPRNKSRILDVFKDYGKEVGGAILLADSTMMVSTILLGSFLATLSTNSVIIVLIVSAYILPYLLYSIPK
jgi:hypothetical protein